jgi:TIGR00730 family protein
MEKAPKKSPNLRPNVELNRATKRGKATQDEQFLAKSHRDGEARSAFTHTDPWRVLRIMGEFVDGFETLADVGDAITIFGSARVEEDDPSYQQAVELARQLGEAGFAIITGGGPGIMEACNKGAKLAGAPSIGCSIELPFEQGVNRYVDIALNFRYFFVRKTMFVKYSQGFVIFPGGFGTFDELFEALTLIQTGKVHNFPIVLFGSSYWKGLLDWLRDTVLVEGKISPADLDLLIVSDDPAEVVQIMKQSTQSMQKRVSENEAFSELERATKLRES